MQRKMSHCLAAELAERAISADGLVAFRREALEALQHAIGFDFATLQGGPRGTTGHGLAVSDVELTTAHTEWAVQQMKGNPAPLVKGRSVCSIGRDLARFVPLSERLGLPVPSSMALRAWTLRTGTVAIGLSRVGAAAAFDDADLDLLDVTLPVIALAEAMHGARTSERDPFADWCERHALTTRQREVALLATRGLRNAEIGELLKCSSETVRNHLAAVFRKAGVASRAELAFEALNAAE